MFKKKKTVEKPNNQQKYKKSKVLNGILGGILALVIAGGVAAVGVFSNGFKDWNKFKKDDTKQEQPMPPSEDSGGSDITAEASNGIRLMSMKLAPMQYAAYGVAANAESAYTVTATVYPEDAANKLLDWTVSFKNASSTWASGKKVTDYVTVTPSSDGALTAVVQNIAAFGEQVVVKVTSRDNTSAYATLNVEYLQRTTGYTLSLDGKTYATTGTKANAAKPTFAASQSAEAKVTVNKSSVYTRANTDKAEYFTIKPTAAFKTAITNAGLSATALKEYSGNASATLSGWFDSTWGTALYANNTQRNKLISAIKGFSGNAYEIVIYTANGGEQLATFGITLDSSVIEGQKGVESVTTDKTELVF